MKKRLAVLFAIALLPSLVRAQGDMLSAKYCVRYIKDHLYYSRGDEMNVVDLEVEWPEVIDGDSAEPLRQFISEQLFKVHASTFASAYGLFRQRFGQPVTSLAQIPDDNKYCYVDCALRLIDHRPGRYVSYVLTARSQPAAASSQPAYDTRLLLTYDLQDRQVLTLPDIIRMESCRDEMEGAEELGPFMATVVAGAIEPIPEWVDSLTIDNSCLVGGCLLVQGTYTTDHHPHIFNSLFSLGPSYELPFVASSYVTPTARRLLKKKAAKAKEQKQWLACPYPALPQPNGQPVFANVDEMPSFPGGTDRLIAYLSSTMSSAVQTGTPADEGKCIVEFVVDSEGNVNDISIVGTVSQVVDREAARLVHLMPRWKAGTINGKPVNTRVKLPLLFSLKEPTA